MATITGINVKGIAGPVAANPVVLSADDILTFNGNKNQLLLLNNPTGGSLTCTIDGVNGTTVTLPGIGPYDVSAGLPVIVAAGTAKIVLLSSISAYCNGAVHLKGAATMQAWLLEQ